MKLQRIKLTSDLPAWRPSDTRGFVFQAKRLRALAQKAGVEGNDFEDACELLLLCSSKEELKEFLSDGIHVRAYLYQLNCDEQFSQKYYPTSEICSVIRELGWPMSRLTLMNLVRVYVNGFGNQSAESIAALGTFIKEGFESVSKAITGDLGLIQANALEIFALDGPKAIAANAVAENEDLNVYLRRVGFSSFKSSEYVKLAFCHYFIEQLEALLPGESSPVLGQLRKPEVHLSTLSDGKLLGHRALEILIDKTPDSGPSEVWRNTVIAIAGDPRVGTKSQDFQNWWQFLGPGRAKKVTSWLSRLDLKIFLDVLEASARNSNNHAIRRMYPPRKIFMEGLLNQNMVVQSRLILSGEASAYLKSNYSNDDVPEHATTRSGHTSIIYLELVGGLHMIEGTDNFKIKILNSLPSSPPILDFRVKSFADSDFVVDWSRYISAISSPLASNRWLGRIT